MDLGPLVPIAAMGVGLGWGIIGLKRKQLEITARHAKEEAAGERSQKQQLEQRVRVLEKIITDGGIQTAAQIEALRKPPASGTRYESALDKGGKS